VLSAACTAALRWGWVPFNPMDAVSHPPRRSRSTAVVLVRQICGQFCRARH
jgi:hypothetical protein